MDECEEKKLMDKIMPDPNSEFTGKERVCDKDVEQALWKLSEEPKVADEESGKGISGSNEKSMAGDLVTEEMLFGMEDISAHSASL